MADFELNPITSKLDLVGSGGSSSDEKVKYDSSDPAAGYVADKVIAGTGISVAEGTGANENKLVITNTISNTDEKIKVSSNDTTAGYLNGKLVAGLNASLTENDNGSDETLTIKGKVEVQTSAPSTPHSGAIWLDTDDTQGSTGDLTATTPLYVTNGTNAVNGTGTSLTISLADYFIAVTSLTTNTTLNSSHNVVLCDGTFDITLPSAAGLNGKIYNIKNTGTGTVTLLTTSSQKIDDDASGTLTLTENQNITVVSNNIQWWKL